ncbi:MAG: cytochrome c [Gammaproteobacteria bacterium]
MKSTLDKIRLGIGVLLTGATLTLSYVYIEAHRLSEQTYDVPLSPFETAAPTPELVAEGERLARIRGCFWCHGESLEGQKYFADPERGVLVIAPNLPRKAQQYSDAEFARAIRQGVRPDGTSVWPAMPAFAYYHLDDADLNAIIAYIRSLPVQKGLQGKRRLWPTGWFRVLAKDLPPNVADLVDHDQPRMESGSADDPVARGAYLAETVCTECHSDNGRLRVPISPDLGIVRAYSEEQFFALMRKGTALNERKIDYHMVDVSKYRYFAMTEDEVAALYAFFTRPLD